MEFRIIKNPTQGAIDILMNRKGSPRNQKPELFDAVGLVQGKLIEMVVAADIAEKSNGVQVEDIRGSCPQNMIMLAIFGDTAAVEDALRAIKQDAEGSSVYANG